MTPYLGAHSDSLKETSVARTHNLGARAPLGSSLDYRFEHADTITDLPFLDWPLDDWGIESLVSGHKSMAEISKKSSRFLHAFFSLQYKVQYVWVIDQV